MGCAGTTPLPDPFDWSDAPPLDDTSFVVFELFTSQSCNACPLADARLSELVAAFPDERVFPLSWHSTRWDGLLGWTDTFSDPRYTERHYTYAEHLDEGPYTPEMVVQGQEAYNGRNAERLDDSRQHWMAQPAPVAIGAVATQEGRTWQVRTWVEDGATVPDDAELQVIVVESGLEVDITAGENRGEVITYDNVVRSWVTSPITDEPVPLPVRGEVAASEVFVLLQDPTTLAVIGATRATADF